MNYIIAIGLVQALLATALLWQGGFRRKGDSILLALMLCIAVHMGIKFSIYTVVSDDAVRAQMNTCIGFCYGPLLLLYRDQLLGKSGSGLRRWYLFLPFVLALIGYLTVISVLTVSAEIGHIVLRRYNATTWILIPVLNGLCALRCLRDAELRSEGEGRRLMQRLAWLLLAGCVVPLALTLFQVMCPALAELPLRSLAYLIIAAMPLSLIWELAAAGKALSYVTMQVAAEAPGSNLMPSMECPAPAPASAIRDATERHPPKPADTVAQEALLEKLERYLLQTAVLTDAELSLDKLAAGVGTSRHQLSDMLNSFAGQSFYDFVNSRRIRRTTEQMAELSGKDIPVNILILAFDNGFKAKSSFNAAFRKFVGMTPTAYLEGLRRPVEMGGAG